MENLTPYDNYKGSFDPETQLQEALHHISQLRSDLFYQIASKHGEEQAFNYQSIEEARVFLKRIKHMRGE